ncbi:MAG: DinB family protein [Terriglobia bacterium]
MDYYGAKDLAESFRTVRKNTITIAQEFPEEKYNFRPAPNTRTVGELLAHISLAYTFQYRVHAEERRSSLEGFDFPSLMQRMAAEEKVQRSKDQTLEMLQISGEKWANWVEGLSESFLGERVAMRAGMTPSSKSRFEMVLSVKEHEMHHRGQLMLIERIVGIVPHLTRQMQARMAAAPGKS